MKRILFAAICAFAAVSAYGQTQTTSPALSPCTLNISKAPIVRGIKLGMKIDDVLALFPGSRQKDEIKSNIAEPDGYPKLGVVGIWIFPNQYSTKDRFAGIGVFTFLFLDGRIAEYQVSYQEPPIWPRVDDFIAKVADYFGLPPATTWTADQSIPYRKTLKCAGFQLQASSNHSAGSLTVSTSDTPLRTQQERRAAYEEKARRDFKP